MGIVGHSGSGKSSLATSLALAHVKRYDIIYSSIIGFNQNSSIEDYAESLNTEVDIRLFDWRDKNAFVEVLKEIEAIQTNNLDDDEKFNILLIVDECHVSMRDYSSKDEDSIYISNFLSVTRHFHCDIYCITQAASKINLKFRDDFHGWYVAIDDKFKTSSDSIEFKKMDKEMSVKDGIKRLNKKKKYRGKSGTLYTIFDFYNSEDDGEKRQKVGMSLLKKRLLMFIGVLSLALVFGFYSLKNAFSLFASDDTNSSTSLIPSSQKVKKPEDIVKNDSNTSFNYSARFELLREHLEHNEVISDFTFISCQFDLIHGLYIFPDRTLTPKNFESLKELFLFELVNTQFISENVYKFEYLVNGKIASLLDSANSKNEKKKAFE